MFMSQTGEQNHDIGLVNTFLGDVEKLQYFGTQQVKIEFMKKLKADESRGMFAGQNPSSSRLLSKNVNIK
jgi:hypothetical protein